MVVRQGIDSKALLVTLIRKLPQLLLLAVIGAVLGGGLHLLVVLWGMKDAMFVAETEYYVDFADGRLEAKDYYNDFTWNDVIATDLILGAMMEELGTGYDRAAVKQMLNADILSDVRYLTITVSGKEEDSVSEVSAAFCKAITAFGQQMDEFDAIYQIEDNAVKREEARYFVWQAAFLGMLVLVGIGIFGIMLGFMVGDRFYTKTDVIKFLDMNALGLLCKKGNNKRGIHEERLLGNLKELQKKNKKIYLLDAEDGKDAALFVERLKAFAADISLDAFLPCERYCVEEDAVILAIVPFEKIYREKITDEINNAILHGGKIAGAVLTECDRRWVDLYYGRKGVKA